MNKKNKTQSRDIKTKLDWIHVNPNENVLLQKILVIVKIDNNEIKVNNAELWLCFYPRPRVEIKGMFRATKDVFNAMGNRKSTRLYFSDDSVEIPGICTSYEIQIGKNEVFLTWLVTPEPFFFSRDKNKPIKKIIFHLFNFVDFIGNRRSFINYGEKKHLIEYLDLEWQDWKVEVRSLPGKKETFDTLKKDGGFVLTHVGSITKDRKMSISIKEAEDFLNALRYFFSFARGFWCYPILCTGFDKHGDKKWHVWNSPREPWQNPLSWFDPHHPEQLINLFSGFMEKWKNELWRDTFREVIYWYLKSNISREVDVGIILTQTAIERLSFEYAVQSKKLITFQGYKNLWASDRFRILFSSLGIPLEIPSSQKNMNNMAKEKEYKWLDVPHALTDVRNSLVHPEKKKRDKIRSVYYEVWNLGLWYLEMSILSPTSAPLINFS